MLSYVILYREVHVIVMVCWSQLSEMSKDSQWFKHHAFFMSISTETPMPVSMTYISYVSRGRCPVPKSYLLIWSSVRSWRFSVWSWRLSVLSWQSFLHTKRLSVCLWRLCVGLKAICWFLIKCGWKIRKKSVWEWSVATENEENGNQFETAEDPFSYAVTQHSAGPPRYFPTLVQDVPMPPTTMQYCWFYLLSTSAPLPRSSYHNQFFSFPFTISQ